MTRFLKRAEPTHSLCGGCVFRNPENGVCFLRPYPRACGCGDGIFTLVPRPPDGTRCRDLDGNIKVVGRDV